MTVQPIGSVRRIPVYQAVLSMGHGSFNEESPVNEFIDIPDEYIRVHLKASPTSVVGVHMQGDSMEPTLFGGDIAIVDCSVNDAEKDDVYAFCFDGGCYIKRLQWAGPRLLVNSDNQAYSPWHIDKQDINRLTIIGRVAGSIRKT
ncbi:S24 family peptidase [Telmatospirillum sp. J64-1]|uniref:S24 family peptidase n=1 Tax=Telmatospirillum sp. J64-1 TaxID=2502183 RepID=UPI002106A69B|nr:S24 family peptidase [Telmatospirillum sp. J64-1]